MNFLSFREEPKFALFDDVEVTVPEVDVDH